MDIICRPNPTIENSGLSELEFNLLNSFQKELPMVSQPFLCIAKLLGVSEEVVIERIGTLKKRGYISRVGAVFKPNTVGASLLVAATVPKEQLDYVASMVSDLDGVNHNYERDHLLNLWFVIAGETFEKIRLVLKDLELRIECGALLVLPLVEQYHIDLGFPLNIEHSFSREKFYLTPKRVKTFIPSETDRKLMHWLQEGLNVISKPFVNSVLSEEETINTIKDWTDIGVIKRFAIVVRHHELGFNANAMVVWDVPDEIVSEIGKTIALSGLVTLCYRRPRRLPDWPFNLFCMIHGKNKIDVETQIKYLSKKFGLLNFSREILFSKKRYKQCGAKYFSLNGAPNG